MSLSDRRNNDLDRAVRSLKSHLRSKLRDTFKDGTVITWVGSGKYHYAAIRSGGKWDKTGESGYPYGFTDGVTLNVLAEKVFGRSDVTDIKVATSFSTL